MCSVNNCHYWGKGNRCEAQQIFVVSDKFADTATDHIDAPQASMTQATPVNNCMETACKTFVPKGSYMASADGVTKQQ
ncbi:hypothetical protein Moth_0712 [Calderihabitans maritimus]|uniref:DUF1540 domain-containing protein n=2 Tax=Calderihabitans maritimus TaxID=1246530 RepID=A0A1Z5HS63_9FIRM|nr:hypothetical protein Moth_0712 [Calderihabitans maritimus]